VKEIFILKLIKEFAECFYTMVKADSAEEKDFHDHPSVKAIRKANENTSFQFKLMTVGEATKELTNLNIKKTSGWDMLPSKVLKLSSETLLRPLPNFTIIVLNKVRGPQSGKKENGFQYLKEIAATRTHKL
jgi:hypothetical protein